MRRGSCFTQKAGNIGLVLRRAVVQGLQVMGDEDVDVCCSGADAPAKVRPRALPCPGSLAHVPSCIEGRQLPGNDHQASTPGRAVSQAAVRIL